MCSLAEPSVWLANGYPSEVRQVRLASSSGVSTFASGSLRSTGVQAPRCSFWVILAYFHQNGRGLVPKNSRKDSGTQNLPAPLKTKLKMIFSDHMNMARASGSGSLA